jgi:hypothetical protein
MMDCPTSLAVFTMWNTYEHTGELQYHFMDNKSDESTVNFTGNVKIASAYLIILPVDESLFKLVLCWVNSQHIGLAVSVQTVDGTTLHHGDVDRHIQGANDAMVTE